MSFLRFLYRLDYLYFWLKWKCKNFVEQKNELVSKQLYHVLIKNPSNSNCLPTFISIWKKTIESYAKIIRSRDFC